MIASVYDLSHYIPTIPAIGIGTIKLQCRKGRRIVLKNALLVPDAAL